MIRIVVSFSLWFVLAVLVAGCLPPPDGCQPYSHSCRNNTPHVCSSEQRYSLLPGSQPCDKVGNGALVCCQHVSPATGRLVFGCALPRDCVQTQVADGGQEQDATQ